MGCSSFQGAPPPAIGFSIILLILTGSPHASVHTSILGESDGGPLPWMSLLPSMKRYRFSTPSHGMRRLGLSFSSHKRPTILQLWLRDCRSEQRPHIWRVPKHRHRVTFTRPATNTACQALVIPGDPVQRVQLSPGQRLVGSESKPTHIKSTQAQALLPPHRELRPLISNISGASIIWRR